MCLKLSEVPPPPPMLLLACVLLYARVTHWRQHSCRIARWREPGWCTAAVVHVTFGCWLWHCWWRLVGQQARRTVAWTTPCARYWWTVTTGSALQWAPPTCCKWYPPFPRIMHACDLHPQVSVWLLTVLMSAHHCVQNHVFAIQNTSIQILNHSIVKYPGK